MVNTDAGWSSLVARRAHNPKVVGSNPAPATKATLAQLVERNLAKVEVTSSNLVCRSNLIAFIVLNGDKDATLAQLVERNLAKVEVTSSNLVCRSKF